MIQAVGDSRRLGRLAGWALVAGLCVAAAVAIVALLTGSFDHTDWRVVGTSLGFSVFTSTAAAGGALRLRDAARAPAIGAITASASFVALVLLVLALWVDNSEAEALWRAFGTAGLLALWTSHASLVLRALQPADRPAVRWLTGVSIVTLGVDTSVGVLAVLGVLEDFNEGLVRGLAALVVVTLVSSALPPVLRRVQRSAAPAASPSAPRSLAEEVSEAVDRLDGMELPPPARAEVARLRRLARDAGA